MCSTVAFSERTEKNPAVNRLKYKTLESAVVIISLQFFLCFISISVAQILFILFRLTLTTMPSV